MRSKRSTYTAARRFSVMATLPGAEAATAANYGKFFVADRVCTVLRCSEAHEALCTDMGATLSIERLQGVEVSGAGDDLLAAPFDMTAVINTTQAPALSAAPGVLTLAVGDRLNLLDAVGVTALVGVCVTVDMEEG